MFNNNLKILLLEDNELDAILIEHELSKEFNTNIKRVINKNDFLLQLEDFQPDIILADYTLPSFDGITALELKNQKASDIPFIFVTGTLGEEIAIESMKMGAYDYVIKSNLNRLMPSVKMALNDLSEYKKRKYAEEVIRESEEKLRLLVENSKDAILILSEDGTIHSANPEACNIFGWSMEEIISGGRDMIVDYEDSRLDNAIKEREKTGSFKGELLFKRKDNSKFVGEVTSNAFKSQNGVVRIAMIIRDVSERIKFEENLKKSHNFYLTLFEEFPTMIWRSDVYGKCNYYNKTWLNFTGKNLENEISEKWEKSIHPDDLNNCVKTFDNAILNKKPFKLEYRLKHHSGEYRWIADFGRPYFDIDGNYAGFIGSSYDISERKELESRILNAIIETEEREKKRFSEDLHDDLGPLLTGIKIYLSSIENCIKNSEQGITAMNDIKSLIDEAVFRTKTIANNLMPNILNDYGFITALKKYCDKLTATNTISIFYEFFNINNRFNKNIEINLYRILVELINNTIKHSEANSIKIEILLSNSKLKIIYKDNGKGFNYEEVMKNSEDKISIGLMNIQTRVSFLNGRFLLGTNRKNNNGMNTYIEIPIT